MHMLKVIASQHTHNKILKNMAQIFTYFGGEQVPMDILYSTVPCWKAVEAQIFLCIQIEVSQGMSTI